MPHADAGKVVVRLDERGGGQIAYITIDRAGKLNALHSTVMQEFCCVCRDLGQRESLRAAVLTGAGDKAFVVGADIDEMTALDRDSARTFITLLHDCCNAVRELPVPVIARIQGYALGAGLELAASCDFRIAADTAIFGMPEVKLGIPSVIEAALLPSLVGWGRARQIMLLGEPFSASDAASWGLVEGVVPTDQLDATVEGYVQSILRAGAHAVRQQKKLIRAWEDLPLRAAIEAGIEAFVSAWETDEPRHAMRSAWAARGQRGA